MRLEIYMLNGFKLVSLLFLIVLYIIICYFFSICIMKIIFYLLKVDAYLKNYLFSGFFI